MEKVGDRQITASPPAIHDVLSSRILRLPRNLPVILLVDLPNDQPAMIQAALLSQQ